MWQQTRCGTHTQQTPPTRPAQSRVSGEAAAYDAESVSEILNEHFLPSGISGCLGLASHQLSHWYLWGEQTARDNGGALLTHSRHRAGSRALRVNKGWFAEGGEGFV